MIEEVRQDLRERIKEGTLADGDVIPSIATLSEQYGTSEGAVRKALHQMRNEGVVERKSGCLVVSSGSSNGLEGDRDHYALTCTLGWQESAIGSLRAKAKQQGSLLTVYEVGPYNQHPELERQFLLKLRRRNYSGVALEPSPVPPLNTDLYHELRTDGMKVALLTPHQHDVSNEIVFLRHQRMGGHRLVEELAQRGFTQFVFIGLRKWAVFKDWIVEGARKAAEGRNVTVREIDQELAVGDKLPSIDDKPLNEWMLSLGADTAVVGFHSQAGTFMEAIRRELCERYPDSGICTVCCFSDPCQGYEYIPRIRYDDAQRLECVIDYLLNNDIMADTLVHEWFEPEFVPGHLGG